MRILVNLACDIVKPCFQADFLVCPLLGLSWCSFFFFLGLGRPSCF
jgi:hypothetical protein